MKHPCHILFLVFYHTLIVNEASWTILVRIIFTYQSCQKDKFSCIDRYNFIQTWQSSSYNNELGGKEHEKSEKE